MRRLAPALIPAICLSCCGCAPVVQNRQPERAPARSPVVKKLSSDERFTTLSRLIASTGLDRSLGTDHPVTLFAPTDDAFARLPANGLSMLEDSPNRGKLRWMLEYHISTGHLTPADLRRKAASPGWIPAGQGGKLKLFILEEHLMVNDAYLAGEAIRAGSVLILPLDRVLLPDRG